MTNPVTPEFAAALRARLAPAAIREVSPRYLEEPRGRWHGQAALVIAPSGVEEVAAVVRMAASAGIGIVPYGGGTGLVGGQVSPDGPAPILLSMERMRSIRQVFAQENTLIAEAGATLAEVQAAAEGAGRLFPLSYASEGTARIGGALSVNSGGLNVLRYGTARDLCLGLEAVLPDGQIWRGLKRLRKDNTGYDLRNLLIGAEGTLGVITAAALRLFPRPARRATAMIVVPNPASALAFLARTSRHAGETISAFELISGIGMAFLDETGLEHARPFADTPDWVVLVELGTAESTDPDALIERLFSEALEVGEALDGVIAQSEAQRDAFWHIRETIPEANRLIGAIASHDISLPLGAVADFMAATSAELSRIAPDVRLNAFGHLGDGNLHYNAFPATGKARDAYRDIADQITRAVHDKVAEFGGSFSAEHGIGRLKVAELERYGDPAKLSAMRAIKAALDPAGIMNPGAVLR